jgi:hypothetical protein
MVAISRKSSQFRDARTVVMSQAEGERERDGKPEIEMGSAALKVKVSKKKIRKVGLKSVAITRVSFPSCPGIKQEVVMK